MIITDEAIDSLLNYSAEEELVTLLGPLSDEDKTVENILGLMTVQNENNLIMALKARGDTYPMMTHHDYAQVAEELDFTQQVGFSSTREGKYVECDLFWNDNVLLETYSLDGIVNNARLYFNWSTYEQDKAAAFQAEEDIITMVGKKKGSADIYTMAGSIDVTAGLAHVYLKLFTEGLFIDQWLHAPVLGNINDVAFLHKLLDPTIRDSMLAKTSTIV